MLQVPIYTLLLLSTDPYTQVKKTSPSPGYISRLRPAPPYIIDLLPPVAYPNNASTSLCTKFVHTSTNKVRGPVNCVTVGGTHPRRNLNTNQSCDNSGHQPAGVSSLAPRRESSLFGTD
jgi:hypothetical protein